MTFTPRVLIRQVGPREGGLLLTQVFLVEVRHSQQPNKIHLFPVEAFFEYQLVERLTRVLNDQSMANLKKRKCPPFTNRKLIIDKRPLLRAKYMCYCHNLLCTISWYPVLFTWISSAFWWISSGG